ncbi:MAG: TetR/AcrR family transcriptional regulator [Proteobacteria bacterium]|nr:TetR/AcrR family transcriptional regulator [Pseudomonadota bacterium]
MERFLLEAAGRVLAEEGPAGFNTNRVAERAGVSVGSLYQYYPNKAALLFRLHAEENRDTQATLQALLTDRRRSPRDRIFAAMRTFFETEAAEAPLREALAVARVYFRDSEEFASVERDVVELLRLFLVEAQPERRGRREFDARFLSTVVASVGEAVTQRGMRGRELRRFADELSAMLCTHFGL